MRRKAVATFPNLAWRVATRAEYAAPLVGLTTDDAWLDPKPAEPLTGSESFGDSGIYVADFWRWAFSDLRENIVRGVLAEFLVAKAVGDPSPLRHAWDNYDVTTPDGTRIEVKSSAYLQSWRQRTHSRPRRLGPGSCAKTQ
jgi:hypothetical protein